MQDQPYGGGRWCPSPPQATRYLLYYLAELSFLVSPVPMRCPLAAGDMCAPLGTSARTGAQRLVARGWRVLGGRQDDDHSDTEQIRSHVTPRSHAPPYSPRSPAPRTTLGPASLRVLLSARALRSVLPATRCPQTPAPPPPLCLVRSFLLRGSGPERARGARAPQRSRRARPGNCGAAGQRPRRTRGAGPGPRGRMGEGWAGRGGPGAQLGDRWDTRARAPRAGGSERPGPPPHPSGRKMRSWGLGASRPAPPAPGPEPGGPAPRSSSEWVPEAGGACSRGLEFRAGSPPSPMYPCFCLRTPRAPAPRLAPRARDGTRGSSKVTEPELAFTNVYFSACKRAPRAG